MRSGEVFLLADGPGGAWRIRSARAGGALLFDGASFGRREDALAFLAAQSGDADGPKWSVKKRKGGVDERQMSLFSLS